MSPNEQQALEENLEDAGCEKAWMEAVLASIACNDQKQERTLLLQYRAE